MEEFLAKKKSPGVHKAEGRKAEEVKVKNLEKVTTEKVKVSTLESNLRGNELYNVGAAKTEHADLLGFQEEPQYEEEGEYRRGGRGGRRGRGRGGY